MSNIEMSDGNISQLNRRRFMKLSAAGVVSLAALELLPGTTKSASAGTANGKFEEKYQIFVPYGTARRGGSQAITLRSGDTIKVEIPRRLRENHELTVKGVGVQRNDVTVICHTLYDTTVRIGDKIYTEIDQTSFIKDELTKDRCKALYESLEDGKFVQDLPALELLDYVIASSKLEEDISQRYSIASYNSRLKGIESAIADALARSELKKDRQKLLKGIYEYVRASEPVPDFAALTDLNAIVAGSNLPQQLKQTYLIASAKSKAFTVDFLIVELISQKLSGEQKEEYLSLYQKVRDGEEISEEEKGALESLDRLIVDSNILETCKTVYLAARTRFFDKTAGSENDPILEAIESSPEFTEEQKRKYASAYNLVVKSEPGTEIKKEVAQDATILLDEFIDKAKIPPAYKYAYGVLRGQFFEENPELAEVDWVHGTTRQVVKASAAGLVPTATSAASVLGVEAGTGVAISSLGGAAATNATLAALGGGSVAAGGLGMLGGLAVATGGAALIGAAGLLSVALLTEMDAEDYRNLGIAGTAGVVTGATVAFVAWTGASALGIAGTLSGAAAITSTISALGGLSFITGGTALVVFGTGFVVWSFLQGNKSRDKNALHQLESRLYALNEPSDDSLVVFIEENLPKEYEREGVYRAPEIPLDKLSNALSKYGNISSQEKVLALIDTSLWGDAKDGILLTDRKIVWKPGFSSPEFVNYSELNWPTIWKVSKLLLSDRDEAKLARFLIELQEQVQG